MGTDATAAAGPGATAGSASDAEILTYGKAEGLFAGAGRSKPHRKNRELLVTVLKKLGFL
jgi:hypothetical protein